MAPFSLPFAYHKHEIERMSNEKPAAMRELLCG